VCVRVCVCVCVGWCCLCLCWKDRRCLYIYLYRQASQLNIYIPIKWKVRFGFFIGRLLHLSLKPHILYILFVLFFNHFCEGHCIPKREPTENPCLKYSNNLYHPAITLLVHIQLCSCFFTSKSTKRQLDDHTKKNFQARIFSCCFPIRKPEVALRTFLPNKMTKA
jgi:hypothetical protein